MSSATIWLENGELKLKMPADPEAIRDFKGSFCASWRTHDDDRKVWGLIATKRAELEEFCARHFTHTIFLGEMPSVRVESAATRKLAEIVMSLPDDLIDKIYKLLIFETHPDRGGDPNLAARVLEARDLDR